MRSSRSSDGGVAGTVTPGSTGRGSSRNGCAGCRPTSVRSTGVTGPTSSAAAGAAPTTPSGVARGARRVVPGRRSRRLRSVALAARWSSRSASSRSTGVRPTDTRRIASRAASRRRTNIAPGTTTDGWRWPADRSEPQGILKYKSGQYERLSLIRSGDRSTALGCMPGFSAGRTASPPLRARSTRATGGGSWPAAAACASTARTAEPRRPTTLSPIVRGGRNTIGNIVPVCRPCNARKGVLLLSEWKLRIRKDRKGAA